MCRWAAFRGQARFLEDLVASPAHSLIAQSHCASQAKTATNGDGFGIAWYGERPEPGLYRDILPAWSDCNLRSLSRQIRSPLFLAHVRASTSGGTRRDNCHPFVSGQWSFMHNGQIGAYESLKRTLEGKLTDRFYRERIGTTDSELVFLLARDAGLNEDPLRAFETVIGLITSEARSLGVAPLIRFTAAFSDGCTLYAIRYATDVFAPTLYVGRSVSGFTLVSEPLDEITEWETVPAGSFVTVDDRGIDIRPFFGSAGSLALAS
ncbi:class II glutamine amidotransferase [Pararhizobium haloflavum]|uniref:class II glutamine amidotransferase n=1 Tax=Pararhizobium haloflavum TaxID=2037914 RepID=UPI000C185552|nr:class II glutamine amidotransferase [Pararhizobium haloflavum]